MSFLWRALTSPFSFALAAAPALAGASASEGGGDALDLSTLGAAGSDDAPASASASLEQQTFEAEQQFEAEQRARARLPTKYDELNQYGSQVLGSESLFEGCKVDYQRHVGERFMVAHTLHMLPTTDEPSTYSFMAYLLSPRNDSFAVSRVSTSGTFMARAQWTAIKDRLAMRVSHQASPVEEQSETMAEVDVLGTRAAFNAKFASKGVLVANYTHRIFRGLTVGAELTHVPFVPTTVMAFAARYRTEKGHELYASGNANGANACYMHQVAPNVRLATDFACLPTADGTQVRTVFSAGWEYILHSATLRAKLDSDMRVTSYLEDNVNPAVKFVLSADMNYRDDVYKFGIGLNLMM